MHDTVTTVKLSLINIFVVQLEKITGITLLGELYSNIEILQKFLVEIVNVSSHRKIPITPAF
jgi:hypothetical protein